MTIPPNPENPVQLAFHLRQPAIIEFPHGGRQIMMIPHFVYDQGGRPNELNSGVYMLDASLNPDQGGAIFHTFSTGRQITIEGDPQNRLELNLTLMDNSYVIHDPAQQMEVSDYRPLESCSDGSTILDRGEWKYVQFTESTSIDLSHSDIAHLLDPQHPLPPFSASVRQEGSRVIATYDGQDLEIKPGEPTTVGQTTLVVVGNILLVHDNDSERGTRIGLNSSSLPDRKEQQSRPHGSVVIRNRGTELTPGDARGQDRVFTAILQNGVEFYAVNDGAGRVGHQIAEVVGQKFMEKLGALQIEEFTSAQLEKICQDIHGEIRQSFREPGSTTDVLLILPNGKRFAIHVGEGNIGLFDNTRINRLFLPHEVQPHEGTQDDKGAYREPNSGSKTKFFGISIGITPEARQLEPQQPVILASDGFWDLLPFINVDYSLLQQHIDAGQCQEAAQYLASQADTYTKQYHGKMADDISVMVVK